MSDKPDKESPNLSQSNQGMQNQFSTAQLSQQLQQHVILLNDNLNYCINNDFNLDLPDPSLLFPPLTMDHNNQVCLLVIIIINKMEPTTTTTQQKTNRACLN